jgi:hypothetical protein
MKTITTSEKETIKVTKSFIKEMLNLERGISYYSAYSEDTLAHAIAYAQEYFGWDGTEYKQDRINDIYDDIEGLVESYITYQNHLQTYDI